MELTLPPHAREIPDDAQLTIMRADGSAWVLHLYMRDLRRLLEAQPKE